MLINYMNGVISTAHTANVNSLASTIKTLQQRSILENMCSVFSCEDFAALH